MNHFIFSAYLIAFSCQFLPISGQYEQFQQPNQPAPVDFDQFQQQQQQIASNLHNFNRQQDDYLKDQIRSVHQQGNDPHFQFVVNDNYTDIEHASEQFINVGQQLGKQIIAPKVIKITKTVAVKIPVPYPIAVDRPVYVNQNGQRLHGGVPQVPKSQHHSHSPNKNHHTRPDLQTAHSAPPAAVYDTAPFYVNHQHEHIKYIPVPVYDHPRDNAGRPSDYTQYTHHELEAQHSYKKPSHQVSSYSSGSAITPPIKNYRYVETTIPQEQQSQQQQVQTEVVRNIKENHHHIYHPEHANADHAPQVKEVQHIYERPVKEVQHVYERPQKEEHAPQYQTHYYYKPQELNTLEEYAHERPAHHSYQVREQDDIQYLVGEQPLSSHHAHVRHTPESTHSQVHVRQNEAGQNEYVRYIYE